MEDSKEKKEAVNIHLFNATTKVDLVIAIMAMLIGMDAMSREFGPHAILDLLVAAFLCFVILSPDPIVIKDLDMEKRNGL